MLVSYNWLKSYIKDIPNEEKVEELITFHICELESREKLENGDTIFDLKILPDRAHDLLSHQGVGREIAGLLGVEFKLPEYKLPESKPTNLKIEIETDGCRRYVGRIIRNVKVSPSPKWMVDYLESIGGRSINNIVDATNIVMFDCGNPIHAFDLREINGEKIVVKDSNNDEKIELVGREELKAVLKDTDVVITDGEKNLALAGVKGGLHSGIKDDTTDILIEVANFDPIRVRKTARRLGIQTDASKRYENEIAQSLCDFAMNEISSLILELCPQSSFEEIIDNYLIKEEKKIISFRSHYISKMLGIHIDDKEIDRILNNYGYKFEFKKDVWEVEVPPSRLDILEKRDFVEEIGRVHGYEKITSKLPDLKQNNNDDSTWMKICFAKYKLTQEGYKEVMTYAFRDKGELEVLASTSNKSFLRTNLSDGLKESFSLNQKNLSLLEDDNLKIFEIGTVFKKGGEEVHVAFADKKGIKEMTLDEYTNNLDLSQEVLNEILLITNGYLKDLYLNKEDIKSFKSWSIYPFITRDIAVWLPEGHSPEDLIRIYKEFGTELMVKEPKLFDSFTKEGKTSYAYRLVFQADDRTLTDDEINGIMEKITQKIISLGWVVR